MKKQKLNNLINKIKLYMLYVLPFILFFSYYPVIKIGESSSMNFELSLPLIWLFLFSIFSLPKIIKHSLEKRKNIKFLISLLIPLYSTLTFFWTSNLTRAILTTGVMWCLWISIYSIILEFKENDLKKKKFFELLIVSTILICVFCWIQCILDVLGVGQEKTLMCAGCVSETFGFPRATGFAIEPQFMGNLLLLPIFVIIYYLENQKQKKRIICIILLFISATLFLTMSRGAIYALGIGMLVYTIINIIKTKKPTSLLLLATIFMAFIGTLVVQGIFAEISTTNDTFQSGVSKGISQRSLGKINIPYKVQEQKPTENESTEEKSENEAKFDGYVEISTNARLWFSELAFKAWTKNPVNFIFGTGVGSAGKEMYEIRPERSIEKEIVQNEFLEVALELGLIGIILLLTQIIVIIKIAKKNQNSGLLYAILISYTVSYFFFSGFPNALHIFLLVPTMYYLPAKDKL